MKTNLVRRVVVTVVALGAAVATMTSATAASAADTADRGATTVVYRGARIQVAISCHYARLHPEGNWLILDAEMGVTGGPIGIPRDAIAVRTPSGDVVTLATQAEFEQGYPEMASAIKTADFTRERLGYLLNEEPRRLDLFRLHGVGWVWQTLPLDPFHNCYGRLYFHLPHGVQRGHYELLIRAPKEDVVLPFVI